jgi:adenylate cyclase
MAIAKKIAESEDTAKVGKPVIAEPDPIDMVFQLLFPETDQDAKTNEVEEPKPIDIDKVFQLLFPEAAPDPKTNKKEAAPEPKTNEEEATPALQIPEETAAAIPPKKEAAPALPGSKEAKLVSILKLVPGFKTLPKEFLEQTVIPYIKRKRKAKMTKNKQAQTDNLIGRLRELNVETKEVLQSAKGKNDFAMVLQAINSLERQIELEGKLLGSISDRVHLLDLLGDDTGFADSNAKYSPAAQASPAPQALRGTSQAAVMFTDIADSTKLYKTIGDDKARELTSSYIQLLSRITADHQGVVVKTIGAEVMCTFPSADAAAQAAVQMQKEVAEGTEKWGSTLNMRIGFHFGDVIEENNDASGEAVNFAARLATQAKAGQIITSGETLDILSPNLSCDSRVLLQVRVKGKADPIRICELTWDKGEAASAPQPPKEEMAPAPQSPQEEAAPAPQSPEEEAAPASQTKQTTSKAAIMFADIAGSTKLYETIGDDKARELTSSCIDLLSRITRDHQGIVIKTIGDEVMCTFPSADEAAEAAVQMQEEVAESADEWGSTLNIRVGFHFGDVIEENNDVFGDAVNLAARMGGQAKADQIITTGETLDIMSPHLSCDTRELIQVRVKGKADPIRICELTWGEEEELTIMGSMDQAPNLTQESSSATVNHGGKEVIVNESNPGASMGRGDSNTFTVPDNKSSRDHAKFEWRRGRVYLIDQSSNGTYLLSDGGQIYHIHRDEHILEGSGVIGLGHEVNASDPLAIHYSAVSE